MAWRFSKAVRGYDPSEVDRYVEDLERHNAELSKELKSRKSEPTVPSPAVTSFAEPSNEVVDQLKFQLGQLSKMLHDLEDKGFEQGRSLSELSTISSNLKENQNEMFRKVEATQERIVSAMAQLSDQLLGEATGLSQKVGSSIDDNFTKLSGPISKLASEIADIGESLAEKVASKTVQDVGDLQRELAIGLTATEEKLKATQDQLLIIAEQLNDRQSLLAEKISTTTDETAVKLNMNQKQLLLTLAQATEGLDRVENKLVQSLERIDRFEDIYEKTQGLLSSTSEKNADLENKISTLTTEGFSRLRDGLSEDFESLREKITGDGEGSLNGIIELGRANQEATQNLAERIDSLKKSAAENLSKEREAILGAITEIAVKVGDIDPAKFLEMVEEAKNSIAVSVGESAELIGDKLEQKQQEALEKLEKTREGLEAVREDVGATFGRALEKMGELSVDEVADKIGSKLEVVQRETLGSVEALKTEVLTLRDSITGMQVDLTAEKDGIKASIEEVASSLSAVEGTLEGGLEVLSASFKELRTGQVDGSDKLVSEMSALTERVKKEIDEGAEKIAATANESIAKEREAILGAIAEIAVKVGDIDPAKFLEMVEEAKNSIAVSVGESAELIGDKLEQMGEKMAELTDFESAISTAARDQNELLMGGLREGFDEAQQRMVEVQESIAASLAQLTDFIAEKDRAAVVELETRIEERFEQSKESIAKALDGLPPKVVADLSGSYGELVGQMGVTFKQNLDRMKLEFGKLIEKTNEKNEKRVEEIVSGKVAELPITFEERLGSTENKISSQGADIVAALGSLAEKNEAKLKRFEEELQLRIEGLSERSIGGLLELGEKMSATQAEELGKVVENVSSDIDVVKNELKKAIDSMKNGLNERDKRVKKIGDDLENSLIGVKESLAGNLTAMIENLKSELSGAVNSINEGLNARENMLAKVMNEDILGNLSDLKELLSASVTELLENMKASLKEFASAGAASSELSAAEMRSLQEKIDNNFKGFAKKSEEITRKMNDSLLQRMIDEQFAIKSGIIETVRESIQSTDDRMLESLEALNDLSESEAQRFSEQAAQMTEIGERVRNLFSKIPKKDDFDSIGESLLRNMDNQTAAVSELLSRNAVEAAETLSGFEKTVESQLGDMRSEFSGIAFRNAEDVGKKFDEASELIEKIPGKTASQVQSGLNDVSSLLGEKLDSMGGTVDSKFAEAFENISVSQAQLAAKVSESLESISSEIGSFVKEFADERESSSAKLDSQAEVVSTEIEQIGTKVDFSRERILTAMRQVTEDVDDIKKNLVERIVSETTQTLKDSYAQVMESIANVTEEKLNATQERILSVLAEATEQLNEIPASMAGQIAERTSERLGELQVDITQTLAESAEKMNSVSSEISDRLDGQIERLGEIEGDLLEKISQATTKEIEDLREEFVDKLNTASEGLQAPVNAVLHLLTSRS